MRPPWDRAHWRERVNDIKRRVRGAETSESSDSREPRFLLGVMTHRANLMMAEEQFRHFLADGHAQGITCVKFVGDPKLSSDWDYDESDNSLCLKCPDDYVNLPNKVYSFLTATRHIYPDAAGVFKTDDDTSINLSILGKVLRRNRRLDYFGRVVTGASQKSDYLRRKEAVTARYPGLAKHSVGLPTGDYCAGGGYFLSRRAVEVIARNEYYFRPFPAATYQDHLGTDGVYHGLNVFEDKTIGHVLGVNGINAVDRGKALAKAVSWANMELF